MENAEKYEVEFFGQKFVFTTDDGNRSDLEKIINYYKKILEGLQEKMPDRSHLDIAILSGLKAVDRLYTIVKNKDGKFGENEDKLNEMLNEAIRRLDISLGI
jgi:cell division protein ZapA (FtsZ GTPase activity inhibitor)